ncbi:MAG: adenylate/guanylate cyclase domain-containing protein [Actinomycetota bacterium]|nr:adenylate/guanylate cyclase domain-containing protein [Actinomycetota bacterium]
MSGDELETALLGAPCELSREEVSELTGVPDEVAHAVWAAMGLPEVPPGERAFTVKDVQALRTALELGRSGLIDEDSLLVHARAMGQALSRLAETQVAVVRGYSGEVSLDEARETALAVAPDVLPRLEELVVYMWRRQFAAAAARSFTETRLDGHPVLAVGFVDLVGYTVSTRHWADTELEALLERFESTLSLRVTAHGGRVVKTLGDEVLFVTDSAHQAAEIALETVQAHAEDAVLPDVRAGLGLGPVLTRLGDVFGQPVNLASRLTREARPASVLVDAAMAAELGGDPTFELTRLKPRPVRGYSSIRPHLLRRASVQA